MCSHWPIVSRWHLLHRVTLLGIALLLVGCMNAPATDITREKAVDMKVQSVTTSDAPLSSRDLLRLPLLRVPAPLPIGSPQLAIEMHELDTLHTSLTEQQRTAVAAWDTTAIIRWNKLARDLVSQFDADPLTASRVYALLSLAQYNTLRASEENQRFYDRHMPPADQTGLKPLVTSVAPAAYPSEHASLAAASATVLLQFFPIASKMIEAQRTEEQESRLWAGVNCRSDIVAGDTLGREIASQLLTISQADFATLPLWDGTMPAGPDKWRVDSHDPTPPASPEWRLVRPWLMSRPDEFRAPPPPTLESTEFKTALSEVRAISDKRSDEQVRIAKFWADGLHTPTPPGHWNQIAADLIVAHRMNTHEAARTFAYLNMALYDAGIAAWDTKYTYWLLRPWQADPAITVVLKKKPQHPSYVSGHSTFSGAAASFLAAVFPDQATTLDAQAQEASMSRVYAGIHYRFDGEAGLRIGKEIGALAIKRWHAEQ